MIWRFAVGGVVMFTAAVLGTWVSDREPPTAIVAVDVMTPTVPPGGELRINYRLHRWRADCAIHADRVIIDSRRAQYSLPDVDFAASPSQRTGEDSTTSIVPIPPNIAQGLAEYRAITTFVCNPSHRIWPIKRNGSAVQFNVSGPPPSAITLPPGSVIIPPGAQSPKLQDRVPQP